MPVFRGDRMAFGSPGAAPTRSPADKCGVGTAYSASSRVWYTLWHGILTEVFYPTVDRPQIRDLRFLITDGKTFVHDESAHLNLHTRQIPHSLGFEIEGEAPNRAYRLKKEVIASPHLPVVLVRASCEGRVGPLRLYVSCNPHMDGQGASNNGYVIEVAGRHVLVAEKNGRWLALGAICHFSRTSVGYVGASDIWTDLADNCKMDWEFDRAVDGNITLTGEIDLSENPGFVVGLAFGESLHAAVTKLFQAFGRPFDEEKQRFLEQWKSVEQLRRPLSPACGESDHLFHASHRILAGMEDKTFQGAFIASPSFPWGETRGDDFAGYHLVWTRDMVQAAMGLLAVGDSDAALRALIYLAISQEPSGRFPQNFWVNGEVYGRKLQLDEVAFPVLLARKLHIEDGLRHFDPRTTVYRAAAFLVNQGPVTGEERWEESGGYSPSTLAVVIGALICAAAFLREDGDEESAKFLEEYADFLKDRLPEWTVTNAGEILPQVPRHFVRLNPVPVGGVAEPGSVETAELRLPSQEPGKPGAALARNVVDAGFLWLVRLGIYAPDDPLIVDSLQVVDAALKVETSCGPGWRRYSSDGYGQRPDGGPWISWGVGRAWPLLTAERGHYELAAGRDPKLYLRTMERFASPAGLLPEQVWDEADLPQAGMRNGGPTGSAMPLLWAHAEYLCLLRSAHEGKVYNLIPEAVQRYRNPERQQSALEIWTIRHPIASARAGRTLRLSAQAPFRLRWSVDGWMTTSETPSRPTRIGVDFLDLPIPPGQREPLAFTFFWIAENRWEERIETIAIL